MALKPKIDGITVPDSTTSGRDQDAVLGEDLLGWAAYLMNAARSAARELIEAASVLIAATDSDVDPTQRASQLGDADPRDGQPSPDAAMLMRRTLGMPDEPVAA
jgi:hypothetical protein